MESNFLAQISTLARVPEHSLPLMRAMSQGRPFCVGEYLFLTDEDWLMAVAYPLRGKYSHAAFEAALGEALQKTGQSEKGRSVSCWAVGADLPPRLQGSVVDRDRFYLLPAGAAPPARLRGSLRRAAAALRVEEGCQFTPAHRRLWAEFLDRAAQQNGREQQRGMAPHVRELYARTPEALAEADGDLRLLNAWDGEGRLVACLLLDYAPEKFCSYVLGAHSRTNYTPHAADLLFAAMLERARLAGKRYVHLGLGVNEGILRFKRKWGGRPFLAYQMAAWEEYPQGAAHTSGGAGETGETARALTLALLRAAAAPAPSMSRTAEEERPAQRPFAMLWEVEKNGKRSWIGGTAHFFCYSFEASFTRLFRHVDTVIFEGPLDEDFLGAVDRVGKSLPPDQTPLADLLHEEEIRRLERVVRGPEGPLIRWLGMEYAHKADVRWLLRHAQPWCAFFSLWTAFLERRGWHESVDMEAWRIAQSMGKRVVGMESMDEQLASLQSVPVERVLRFLRACDGWGAQSRRNMRAYLAGDLEQMMGSSAEFPTRTEYVVSVRDQRFRERMRPYLEEGRCAVFVGAAHMLNLRYMLTEDGFTLRRCLPSLRHKWRALWRKSEEVGW